MTAGYLHVSRVNALQKPTTRSEESIVERREVQIKHLMDTAAVKDWNKRMRSRQERQSCVGDLLMTHTRRSRGGVRESLPHTGTHLCLSQHPMLTTRR